MRRKKEDEKMKKKKRNLFTPERILSCNTQGKHIQVFRMFKNRFTNDLFNLFAPLLKRETKRKVIKDKWSLKEFLRK